MPRRATRELGALEVAEAAVLADLTVGMCLLGWLLPLGSVLIAAAVAPMAALGARHRLRVVVAGGIGAVVTSLLLGGLSLASNVALCAVLGSVVGAAERRDWSRARTLTVAACTIWPIGAGLAVAGLFVFASLRQLLIKQFVIGWRGTSVLIRHGGFTSVARHGDQVVSWLTRHWWLTVPLGLLAALEGAIFVAQLFAHRTLRRLARSVPASRSTLVEGEDAADPDPLPAQFCDVSYQYPGAAHRSISELSLFVPPDSFTAVIGPNGSGKTTLARLLGGRRPTSGSLRRPGGVGLGVPRGTAMVFQHPESQVLGMRVRDDVVWGLDASDGVDVAAVLARVGLAGFEDRDTSTLSGGELQRLAVAAALARRPALLISDETTAMVDSQGRAQLTHLLAELPATGTAVVHITHRIEETAGADHLVRLDHGRLVTRHDSVVANAGSADARSAATRQPVSAMVPRADPRSSGLTAAGDVEIRLAGVGHVYDDRSPWAHRALRDVDLSIRSGEGILVHGLNGSGKSTLAWILAGLLDPSEGTATMAGTPLSTHLDRLGLSFQHARLQLQRSTVRDDVCAASGTDRLGADQALASVGLDPAQLGARQIDALSGGQQRRVALAGLLAAKPRVLILDEPFAGLDEEARAALVTVLRGLRERNDITLVLISHDFEDCADITERVIELERGRIVADSDPVVDPPSTANRAIAAMPRGHAARTELHLFRLLPQPGPLHRLWAGTKLLCLVALALTATANPTWPALGVLAAVVVCGLIVGRVPRRAAPRLPRWLWLGFATGLILSLLSGGAPHVSIAGAHLGLGSTLDWLRGTSLAMVLLTAAALVSWTTSTSSITPALYRLCRPLEKVGLPIEQWAIVVSLSLRCLPLLLEETRVLAAARRMRAAHTPTPTHRRWHHRMAEPADLLAAATVTATRRAAALADAIEARGGPHRYSAAASTSIRKADVLVLAGAALICGFVILMA